MVSAALVASRLRLVLHPTLLTCRLVDWDRLWFTEAPTGVIAVVRAEDYRGTTFLEVHAQGGVFIAVRCRRVTQLSIKAQAMLFPVSVVVNVGIFSGKWSNALN